MFLKINNINTKHSRRQIKVNLEECKVYDGTDITNVIVEFVCESEHKMNIGEKVLLCCPNNNDYSILSNDFIVLSEGYSPTTFRIKVPKYIKIGIKEIVDTIDASYIYPYGKLPIINPEKDIDVIEYREGEYFNINGCRLMNEFAFISPVGLISKEYTYYIGDSRYVNAGQICPDILVYEYVEKMDIVVPLDVKTKGELNREQLLSDGFRSKRMSLIPEIIDCEKRCFSPALKINNNLLNAEKLVFNLYLRDRSGNEDWLTSDNKGWNQFKMDDDGNFIIDKTTLQKEGDLIGVLDFNDDDIYYRKKKVARSFIRLSFYDSMDPTNQMLLHYSTIFLDTAELYNRYIKIANKTGDYTNGIVNEEFNNDTRLGLTFSAEDRYNQTKSSEGFYLYCFPDYLENENERVIYMKVEFNHAGYGRTIPLMFPRSENGILYNFNSDDFPTSFNGDWKKCNEMLYFPVHLKYDMNLKEYIYYFPHVQYRNKTLVFDLYEPRINNLE